MIAARLLALGALAAASGCTPAAYQPEPTDTSWAEPEMSSATRADAMRRGADTDAKTEDQPPKPSGPLTLDVVLESVTSRYPPLLSALLERDLASGRLLNAMGGFDANLSGKVGGRLQGFYESTIAQAFVEQPLATGDTLYGGYRVSDGFLPDYYDDRTQDDGVIVLGLRIPLLQNRSIDSRRASVRRAQIGQEIAEPRIRRAQIDFVRSATKAYAKWQATGRKLSIARELLQIAMDRQAGLQRGVERQFLAPIVLTDNERLITQRRIFVTRAERSFRAASLALSLFLRTEDDRPIVPDEPNLPPQENAQGASLPTLEDDLAQAARRRPDLRELGLAVEQAEVAVSLADNQTLPDLSVVLETESDLSGGPYTDREDFEFFVGGELKVPIQRRSARGRLEEAQAKLGRLRLKQRFAKDKITNDVIDARVAVNAASDQLDDSNRNVDLAEQLVAAENRAFDLGRSNLLLVQLREAQLADARVLEIDAQLARALALADYRAATGWAND